MKYYGDSKLLRRSIFSTAGSFGIVGPFYARVGLVVKQRFTQVTPTLRKCKFTQPKGPFRTVFGTESDSVVFCYSVVNLLRIVIHYSRYSKSEQNVVIHYIFSSESLSVVNSLQIVNSLRVLFLVCRSRRRKR